MGPEDLQRALGALPPPPRAARLLVGPDTWDDAGVYRVSARLALVQTVDFITPVVNDPFAFGRIAAANSLSDVYAMGARPKTALSIVAFPADTEDPVVLREILRGGLAALRAADVLLLGGHTVRDPEIKFGFAVTGEVDPRRVVTNARARAGDLLILTKPLGTGILATALKQRRLTGRVEGILTRQMASLNRAAAEAMVSTGASAATDVSGFGLLGHAFNVARASRKTIRFFSAVIPTLPQAIEFVEQGVAPRGLAQNEAYMVGKASFAPSVPLALRRILVDPQTSGGLLIAIAPSRASRLLARLKRARILGAVVGEVRPRGRNAIVVDG